MDDAITRDSSTVGSPGEDVSGGLPTEKKEPRGRDRTLLAVLVVVGILVAVAVAVVFSRGPAAPLDSQSPEGAVQRYTAAVVAGDEQAAGTFLSDRWLAQCDPNQSFMDGSSVRVTLVSTTERPESADVHVLITTSYEGDPFGAGSSSYEEVFDLVKVDHRWKIDTAPWELAVCPTGAVTQ
jgi:hypothetical protein